MTATFSSLYTRPVGLEGLLISIMRGMAPFCKAWL
jgi:hypothetical protein